MAHITHIHIPKTDHVRARTTSHHIPSDPSTTSRSPLRSLCSARSISILALLAFVVGSAWGANHESDGCPRLSINGSVPRNVRPGQIVTYMLRVKNLGSVPVKNLYIDAELPPSVEFPAPPKREGWDQLQSWTVSPKSLTYDGVFDLGTTIELQNVRMCVLKQTGGGV